jgi:hypothetical protein
VALCIYETALITLAKSDGTLKDFTFIAESGASSNMFAVGICKGKSIKGKELLLTFRDVLLVND